MNDELSKRAAQVRRAGVLPGIFILAFIILTPLASAEYRVHLDYDWEADDEREQDPLPEFESCFPCHGEEHLASVKICEDCHLPDGAGPYREGGEFVLRADYRAQKVYEHYYGAKDIDVDDQSHGAAQSTCFSFDPVVEGTCHGVSYVHRDSVGGYFAFNENWTEGSRERDPYEFTAPASFLPDAADCLFCHNQDSEEVRYAWGNATQIDSGHSALANTECYKCHVEGAVAPLSFHGADLYLVPWEESEEGETIAKPKPTPKLENRTLIPVLILAALALAFYLLIRARGSQK